MLKDECRGSSEGRMLLVPKTTQSSRLYTSCMAIGRLPNTAALLHLRSISTVWRSGPSVCTCVCFCVQFRPSPSYRPLLFSWFRLPASSALFPAICGLTLSRSLLCLPKTLHLLLTLHHSRSLSVPLISSAFPFFPLQAHDFP